MVAATLGAPVTALVAGSVVWKTRLAGIGDTSEMPTACAAAPPELRMVTNAVAAVGTWTERLAGSTAAASAGLGVHPATWVAKSNSPAPVPACAHVPDGMTARALSCKLA